MLQLVSCTVNGTWNGISSDKEIIIIIIIIIIINAINIFSIAKSSHID